MGVDSPGRPDAPLVRSGRAAMAMRRPSGTRAGRSQKPGWRGVPAGLAASRLEFGGLDLAVLEWPGPDLAERMAALTPSELDVVRLALEGLSNEAIATRRGSAERTVANQLASAYAKLGVGSRAEAAAWAARRGGGP